MSNARFSVSPAVFEQFPDYVVGWVGASIDQTIANHEDIISLLRAAEQRVQALHVGKDLKELPTIAAWRTAFSALGWSASKYPSSVEALLKRVARGGSLPAISPIVDLVNAVSLTYVVPVGCHDLERSSPLELRRAGDGDTFLPMGDAEAETLDPCEIVYASGNEVRTRRWVWRQSRTALVTAESSWIFIPVDGFKDISGSNVEAAVAYLSTAISDYFGVRAVSGWIDRDLPVALVPALQVDQ